MRHGSSTQVSKEQSIVYSQQFTVTAASPSRRFCFLRSLPHCEWRCELSAQINQRMSRKNLYVTTFTGLTLTQTWPHRDGYGRPRRNSLKSRSRAQHFLGSLSQPEKLHRALMPYRTLLRPAALRDLDSLTGARGALSGLMKARVALLRGPSRELSCCAPRSAFAACAIAHACPSAGECECLPAAGGE